MRAKGENLGQIRDGGGKKCAEQRLMPKDLETIFEFGKVSTADIWDCYPDGGEGIR